MTEQPRPRIVVYHEGYGCDTGCCGHVIYLDTPEGEKQVGGFNFDHPGYKEDRLEWAKELIRDEMGEEHVADLDWENCTVSDD